MKNSISTLLILLILIVNFVPVLSTTGFSNLQTTTFSQSTTLSNNDLQQVEGGVPALTAAACAALLIGCLQETEGWWADLACIGLTAVCLVV
ncbi:MAG: bacteriocin [Bacteroidota bacterium]|jgi:bacteriocin-like protein